MTATIPDMPVQAEVEKAMGKIRSHMLDRNRLAVLEYLEQEVIDVANGKSSAPGYNLGVRFDEHRTNSPSHTLTATFRIPPYQVKFPSGTISTPTFSSLMDSAVADVFQKALHKHMDMIMITAVQIAKKECEARLAKGLAGAKETLMAFLDSPEIIMEKAK